MAQIQITDLNPSDFGFMEELTDEELLAINGGKWWHWVIGGAAIVGGIILESGALIAAGLNFIESGTSNSGG